jgi:hypothetical protein
MRPAKMKPQMIKRLEKQDQMREKQDDGIEILKGNARQPQLPQSHYQG